MEYIWDENKRTATLRKHGLDFIDAPLVYEHPDKLTVETVRNSEHRKIDIAKVRRLILTLIYTERQGCIRLISFRPASKKERRYYNEQQDLG